MLKRLRRTEDTHKIDESKRIKFVETSGRKFIDQLKINDPFESKCKTEENCLVCESSKNASNCKISNIGYSITCTLCKERDIVKTYEGETCQNAHVRAKEHHNHFANNRERSVMYKHTQTDHKDEIKQVRFEMKVVNRFKDPMNQQIDESLRINRRDPKSLLNSKKEYYGPVVKRKITEK